MDDNQSGRRNPPMKLPRDKVFGANSFQLSEEDSFKLVGSIVEKGISGDQPVATTSSAPQPSVLPFPVAHLRSRGPNWGPKVEESHGDYEEDNNDEIDAMNYNPKAQFANPIKKKKKQGLDLSNWREFLPSNGSLAAHKKEAKGSHHSHPENQKVNTVDMGVEHEETMSDSLSESTEMNIKPLYPDPTTAMELDGFTYSSSMSISIKDDAVHSRNGMTGYSSASVPMGECKVGNAVESENISLFDTVVEKGKFTSCKDSRIYKKESSTVKEYVNADQQAKAPSLENQIDAENQAMLESMSPDEIAEAQAEIRDRLNPQLLSMLKKRGKEKLQKHSTTKLGSSASDETSAKDVERLPVADRNASSLSMAAKQKDLGSKLGENEVQVSCSGDGNLWGTWSNRVEAVRNLRFSLDGNLMDTECFPTTTSVLDAGNNLGDYTSDNVAERDFLRTGGDPAAAGYTIKEALALTRSVIPGQRGIALHLLSSVLNNALQNMHQGHSGNTVKETDNVKSFVDWEAVWAFALGPEPELVLSLRLSLDDNHESVVLACTKAVQCLLSYDWNEQFFDISDKLASQDKHLYTAPVFRSKPDICGGFLHGGFWKYSAKPSNIDGSNTIDGKAEGEQTIQDDSVIAGQDIAAGLVRMGILHRLRYLLEADPAVALEECILSILIAIARHSPTCADAILNCERLLQTVQDRFMLKNKWEAQACKAKSVKLFRVLALSENRICSEFVKNGTFEKLTWQLHQGPSSLMDLIVAGKEHCKLSSWLTVEQLRFWKVCIEYGHCVSYFTYFYPALCFWLSPPTIAKLIEKDIIQEFASVAGELYLVLGALAKKLPEWNTRGNADTGDNAASWCWNDAASVVDIALKWISLGTGAPLSILFGEQNGDEFHFVSQGWKKSLLWVISAIFHMLATIIIRATPFDSHDSDNTERGKLLLDLVAKIGLPLMGNGFLISSGPDVSYQSTEINAGRSFIQKLCQLRHHSDRLTSLASVCCLHGVLKLAASIDQLVDLAKNQFYVFSPEGCGLSREERILHAGILKCSLAEWKWVLCEFMKCFNSAVRDLHTIEVFGRGGPAPGVGIGWGVFGGGFWSSAVSLVQTDARFLVDLLPIFLDPLPNHLPGTEDKVFTTQTIYSTLAICLAFGPGDIVIAEKALEILLQVPIMKHLSLYLSDFLHNEGGRQLVWEYNEKDFVRFSNILSSHFKKRWLSTKRKKPGFVDEIRYPQRKRHETSGSSLATIGEEMASSAVLLGDSASLAVEWAHQRFPLPSHWLLSPIATIGDAARSSDVNILMQDSLDILEVCKAGLFFLLGIEAVSSSHLDTDYSPFRSIPLVWKMHSLSVAIFPGMGVLEDERSRDVYEALQGLYGRHLDELRLSSSTIGHRNHNMNLLNFKSDIHESYSTFIETLVDQFSAISYGDSTYGRQVAIYLHRCVESSSRLSAWSALSNAHVLELLPSIENLISKPEGYLGPPEEDESLLEAYLKSWVTGTLDKAVTRRSVAYTIALHHLSSFIFSHANGGKLKLRNRITKSLLRDYSRKQLHEVMMLDLIKYKYQSPRSSQSSCQDEDSWSEMPLSGRLQILSEACEGNSSLLAVVERLRSACSGDTAKQRV